MPKKRKNAEVPQMMDSRAIFIKCLKCMRVSSRYLIPMVSFHFHSGFVRWPVLTWFTD